MIVVKSVSLSVETAEMVELQRKRLKTNFSKAIETIIHEHYTLFPVLRKKKEIEDLKAAAESLFQNFDLPQEAIICFVRDATGGWKKESAPETPKEKEE